MNYDLLLSKLNLFKQIQGWVIIMIYLTVYKMKLESFISFSLSAVAVCVCVHGVSSYDYLGVVGVVWRDHAKNE